MTDERLRWNVQTILLGVAVALLVAPLVAPTVGVSTVVAFGGVVAVTVPATWLLVIGRADTPEDVGRRFADAGRFYVLSFVLYWLPVYGLRVEVPAIEGTSTASRLVYLGVCVVAGYWLGYLRRYRTLLARLYDAWVKDLPEEDREELESLRDDGGNK